MESRNIEQIISLCRTAKAVNKRLTFDQLQILLHLRKAGDDGLIKSEVAKRVGITQGGVAKACDKLTTRGRVIRGTYDFNPETGKMEGERDLHNTMGMVFEEKDPTNHRAIVLRLTTTGNKFINQLEETLYPETVNA